MSGFGVGSGGILESILDALIGRLITDSGVWAYVDPISTSDTVDIPGAPARGLMVLTNGNVTYEVLKSDGVTRFVIGPIAYTAKEIIPAAVYRVHTTGTTASVVAGF